MQGELQLQDFLTEAQKKGNKETRMQTRNQETLFKRPYNSSKRGHDCDSNIFQEKYIITTLRRGGGEVLPTSKKSNTIFLDSLDVDIKRRKTTSPDLRTQLTGCGRHPSSRVVNVLTNLPARHVLHNSGLLLQVFFPLFDKSMDYRNIIGISV